jgi:hypothetical protein
MLYPPQLPEPFLTHTLEYQEVFKKTEFGYGVRYRATQNIIRPKNTLSFSLYMNTAEYLEFRKFLRNLNNCIDWFEANWDYDGQGITRQYHFEAYPSFSKSQDAKQYKADFTVTVKE